jgi:hypothetical protein
MSSGNKSFVVLGPLSFLPHACPAHAVVRPELSCLVSAKRDKATGLSPADYSGCTTVFRSRRSGYGQPVLHLVRLGLYPEPHTLAAISARGGGAHYVGRGIGVFVKLQLREGSPCPSAPSTSTTP